MEEKTEKYTAEQREKDDKYIMERMQPAAMIPGFLVAFIVIVGWLFKNYMGW